LILVMAHIWLCLKLFAYLLHVLSLWWRPPTVTWAWSMRYWQTWYDMSRHLERTYALALAFCCFWKLEMPCEEAQASLLDNGCLCWDQPILNRQLHERALQDQKSYLGKLCLRCQPRIMSWMVVSFSHYIWKCFIEIQKKTS
jgi:hypothetical protein